MKTPSLILLFMALSSHLFAIYNPAQGRFLNRDPIGETGGKNLYGFVANDGINRWDYLGLWEIERNPNKEFASATAEENDTWSDLSKETKLELSEYQEWVKYYFNGDPVRSGEDPSPGCQYRIPNVAYVLQGDVSGSDYKPLEKGNTHTGLLGFVQNVGLGIKSAIIVYEMRANAAENRYKTVVNYNATSQNFLNALKNPYTQAIYWHSHGDSEGVYGANEVHFTPDSLGDPHHKVGLLWAYACNSYGCYSGWINIVSSSGDLRLFDGLLTNPFSEGVD